MFKEMRIVFVAKKDPAYALGKFLSTGRVSAGR